MPAAATKADLIAITEREYAKLLALISPLREEQAMKKREQDTSIKDIIAHRAHWITLFLGWYADGVAGRDVAFPAPGYKWSDLKAYNADLRATQSGLSWDQAKADLADAHAALLSFLQTHDDKALYAGPMPGARNAWTTGRWAEAAGPSHYRSAAKWIRACLRDDAKEAT